MMLYMSTAMHDVVKYDLRVDPAAEGVTVQNTIEKMRRHIRRLRNVAVDKVNFHSRQQMPGESFTVFCADVRRLHSLADLCVVCRDHAIADRILAGMRDEEARRMILEKEELPPLEAMLRQIQAKLRSRADNNTMVVPQNTASVSSVASEGSGDAYNAAPTAAERPAVIAAASTAPATQRHGARGSTTSKGNAAPSGAKCGNCNRTHAAGKANCPANGKSCNGCGKPNHFASVCRSRNRPNQRGAPSGAAAAAVTVGNVDASYYGQGLSLIHI